MTGGVVRRDGLREHGFAPMPGSRCAECNGYADEHARVLDAVPDARMWAVTRGPAARAIQAGARALEVAADALEGSLGVEGKPQNPYEFRQWLRERAAALRSDPVVPPDPPAVDRDELAQWFADLRSIELHGLAGREPVNKWDRRKADALIADGVLVAAADVRARARNEALDEVWDYVARRQQQGEHPMDPYPTAVACSDVLAFIKSIRSDRAVSEREGGS